MSNNTCSNFDGFEHGKENESSVSEKINPPILCSRDHFIIFKISSVLVLKKY
jgi:hypothetical protein